MLEGPSIYLPRSRDVWPLTVEPERKEEWSVLSQREKKKKKKARCVNDKLERGTRTLDFHADIHSLVGGPAVRDMANPVVFFAGCGEAHTGWASKPLSAALTSPMLRVTPKTSPFVLLAEFTSVLVRSAVLISPRCPVGRAEVRCSALAVNRRCDTADGKSCVTRGESFCRFQSPWAASVKWQQ